MKNKPIPLSDGTWNAPASLEGLKPGQNGKQWRAFADISHDLGKNGKTEFGLFYRANGYGNISVSRSGRANPVTCTCF